MKNIKHYIKKHKKEIIIAGGAAALIGGCVVGYRVHLASTKRTIGCQIVKGHEDKVSVIIHDEGWLIPYKGACIPPEDAKNMAARLNELADTIIEGGAA